MSLCSQCGHNSVFHQHPCRHVREGVNPVLGGWAWVPCGCDLRPGDDAFREGWDDVGNLTDGFPVSTPSATATRVMLRRITGAAS